MTEITLRHESYKDGEGLTKLSETTYQDAARVAVFYEGRHVGSLSMLIAKAAHAERMGEALSEIHGKLDRMMARPSARIGEETK